MKYVTRFYQLSYEKKVFLLKSFILIYFVQLILWVFPFYKSLRIIKFIGNKRISKNCNLRCVETISWSVMVASLFLRKKKCLKRTLTAYILLKRHNYPTTPKINIKWDKSKLKVRSWLENDDKVILGVYSDKYEPLDFEW
jgi:hypothetical protein